MNKYKMEKCGILYKEALKRFGGNELLYEKYIKRFQQDCHFQKGKEAFERKDFFEVEKQIHAMKGMTGTLGMEELYQRATDVVEEIRKNHCEKLSIRMEELEKAYDMVMRYY